jgi:DNA recombination protein RmuC
VEIALIALSALTLVLVLALLVKSGRGGADKERLMRLESELASLRLELSSSMQQGTVLLSGQITKSGADMRQEVADRIAKGLEDITARVESQLTSGRQESTAAMTATTESVMKRLGEFGDKTEVKLESIREKVDQRLMSIGQQVQAKLDENMKEGFSHFEKVQEHLKKAEAQLMGVSAVGTSINELNSLLKLPHLRGGFGEAALEMLISDFLPSHMYELQAQVSPNSTERVDVLVKLPGASLPIDSKFPREQVLPLFEASDERSLAEARRTLSRVVREQAKDIAGKYIRPEDGTTDMALMFLPSETLYFEVIRDAELWGTLQRFKVFPVSPNTLAVTLRGITLSYEYYRMAKGVEKTIESLGKARKHMGHFTERFELVGRQLDKAKDAYNIASTHLGHYQSSVARLTGEGPEEAEEEGQRKLNIDNKEE